MIIIGFSCKTSKILPRILCRNFKHCAPIIVQNDGTLIMYQFVRRGCVAKIELRMRDIKTLIAYGWKFIYLPRDARIPVNLCKMSTCVQMTKHILGIQSHILTPDGLYNKLASEYKTPHMGRFVI